MTGEKKRGIGTFLSKFFVFCLIVFLSFEIGIRLVGNYDNNGQFQLAGIKIPPYVLDYERIAETVQRLENPTERMSMIYDPATGSAPNPQYRGKFNEATLNSQGIRSSSYDVMYSEYPSDGVLRIAVFGDSNVMSSPVTYEESWEYVFQQYLIENGIPAEVLNFGVQGYSPAQSEQRWETIGQNFHPDIVIYGGQIFNIRQSTNLYRGYLLPDPQPTLMPVFYLGANGLELVNSPVPPPAETIEILRNFEQSPLSEYEQNEPQYNIFYQSRLYGLLARTFEFNERSYYEPETIHSRTFAATVDYFAESVESTGAIFYFMHITTDFTLGFRGADKRFPHQAMLDEIASRHPYIETQQLFPAIDRTDWIQSHYSPPAAQKVGEYVGQVFLECWQDGTCRPARLQ